MYLEEKEEEEESPLFDNSFEFEQKQIQNHDRAGPDKLMVKTNDLLKQLKIFISRENIESPQVRLSIVCKHNYTL